jgi:hypothetical protein
MSRPVFKVLITLSLALFITAAVMWARSYWVVEALVSNG